MDEEEFCRTVFEIVLHSSVPFAIALDKKLLVDCLMTCSSVDFPAQDEKRYYQMELVNRETNFNKVFTSSEPKVGVLNPLAFQKVSVCV